MVVAPLARKRLVLVVRLRSHVQLRASSHQVCFQFTMRFYCNLSTYQNVDKHILLGTLVDEFDPAFQDLLQSTSGQHASDAAEDGGGSDLDAGGDAEEGAAAVDDTGRLTREDANTERSDAWIAAIYEDDVHPGNTSRDQGSGAERLILSVVAVSVQAHRVQCRVFTGDSAVEAVDDFLTLLMVRNDGSKLAIVWLRLLLDSLLHL